MSNKEKKELKDKLNKGIRSYIRANPKVSNQDVGAEFNVSWQSARANRAHVSMGTDTDNPQARKESTKKASTKMIHGLHKLSIRTRKVKAILKTRKLDGLVLTLCGASQVVEKQLYMKGAKGFSYDLVESDEDVFKTICGAIATSPLKINSISKHSLSKKIFEAHEDKYAHGIFDYYNSINYNKSDIDMTLENNIIQVGGVLCMTFSIRASKPIMSVPSVENECANLSGAKAYLSTFENYKVVDGFTYKDGMPMMVIILKRMK